MLKNKTAVITGCSKGIGKACLDLFLENNATVIACLRNKDNNLYSEINKKHKKKIKFYYFDLENIEEVKATAKDITKDFDKIDVLVNNAGAIQTSLFQMTKIEDMKKLFEINFFSQLAFTQIIIKKMIKLKNGSIINISTNAALEPFPGRISYSASKSALISASRVLSKELGPFNIRVNCLAPGLTETELMNKSHNAKIIHETKLKTSLQKIASPLEIANVILFLASSQSSHITGEVIRVDGGF